MLDIEGPFALEEYGEGELEMLGLRNCDRVLRVFTQPHENFTATATRAFPSGDNDTDYYEYAAFFFEGDRLIAMSQGLDIRR